MPRIELFAAETVREAILQMRAYCERELTAVVEQIKQTEAALEQAEENLKEFAE